MLIFTLGGLAGAVFYLPFKRVKNWAWESYWLIYAVFGLIVVPWVLALCTSPNVMSVLTGAPKRELVFCYLCGAMWGVGGLTWGLMIRYLGVGLGLAIGCGLCSAAGTLVPKMLKGEFAQLFEPGAGIASFLGVLVSLVGIVLVGLAGMSKEKELPDEEKKKAVAEFNFKKGILVAIFSGLMSAGMSFGLQGGPTLETLACPLFAPNQFRDTKLTAFVNQLKSGADPVSQFLWAKFSPKAKEQLGSFKGEGAQASTIKSLLAEELNRVMQAGSIYDPQRFAAVNLPDKTRQLLAQSASAAVPVRLNRLLLEQAYTKDLGLKTPQIALLDRPTTSTTWKGMPVLVMVLLGGFTINFLWCLFLNIKNKTTGDYTKAGTPLLANLIFAGLAGAIWCSQFICFKTGEPAMGETAYVGWAVLMASAILFSTLLGIFLGEWNGTSGRTRSLLAVGLVLLLSSSVIAGYSGYLGQKTSTAPALPEAKVAAS